ncbi:MULTISPECIES: ANTAR domain-containing response regulator [unclassified Streptomyces]|uniref:ANTAR domain-containing response regulator n=1 Tax=unclassified Streptomyces TaxID=2593676 RepID=UPI0022556FF3|nr:MULTISPECIES: GAF and ANTAR domain-containing protein [unclassified Streptomyces]MCX5052730.1 ANTAR domain-containing protein [Streptomyces sp. NBC_00474]MCX5062551.1 ANTAR domain-containing protein [Streptomyces sp. NBC_00452]MCX5250181.1 ANTAR domain-containing protein [Streptomyces sp. NBC_00201]MCX5291841.1 ANTAR domain-containing protein [Streptomyces sp. NBC_00183]
MPETGQHARRWGTEPAEPALVGRRLSELVEEAVRCTVDCCGASGLVAEGGSERPAAVSHPDLAPLVAVQLQSGDGPIPAALEHGEPARSPDLLREDRWPDYRALALDSGVRSSVTLPFRRAGLAVTLSLYSFRPGALEDAPHGAVRALGDLAMTCIVRDRSYRAALTELDQLGTALRSRPLIDQACGIVMHVLGCDADDAFGVLRRISQVSNRKLSDVASAVVERRGRGLERDLAALMN